MSLTYGDGFFFFEKEEWRRGPLPLAADARFRPPRAGDILKTDEASLRQAHQQCLDRLRQFERDGYRHPVAGRVHDQHVALRQRPAVPAACRTSCAAWNKLGLQPKLRLTTVTQAMKDLEKAAGKDARNTQANGPTGGRTARCAPRAKWPPAALPSASLPPRNRPCGGRWMPPARSRIEELTKDLCLFDEHTWGSGMSVGQPYSLDAQGQWNEKARLAWRPMALAEWLLGQRARTRLVREGEGLWLANPASAAFSGWATMIASCLRDDYRSLIDPVTGAQDEALFRTGTALGSARETGGPEP